jgi:ubiquinone/menaquinone biosynthesis C-methylase UbiE
MAQELFLDPPMPDILAQWRFYLATLQLQPGQVVIDIGCNNGEAERLLLNEYPSIGRVIGIEKNQERYSEAVERWQAAGSPAQVEFRLADAQQLPFPDDYADRILCVETLEWVKQPDKALQEMHRVLKRGGLAVVIHTDFDTQIFNAADKQRSRKIVHLFSDTGPNGQIGRELYGLCQQAGFQTVEPLVYCLTNQAWRPDLYGYRVARMMADWLKSQSLISQEELTDWLVDLEAQQANGCFFYSVNRYICCCRK